MWFTIGVKGERQVTFAQNSRHPLKEGVRLLTSLRSDYALRILVDLAMAGPSLLKDLARRQGLPVPFLKRIVADLSRSGLIITQRGQGGGMALARAPHEIRIIEIREAIDPEAPPVGCPDLVRPCMLKDRCPICAFWERASAELAEIRRTTTVADFLPPSTPAD